MKGAGEVTMKAYHVTEQRNYQNIKNNGFIKTRGTFGEGVYFYDDCSKAKQRGEEVNNQFTQSNLVVIKVELSEEEYIFLNSHDEYSEFCEKYNCNPGNHVSWNSSDLFNKGIKGIVFKTEYINEIVVYDLDTIVIL